MFSIIQYESGASVNYCFRELRIDGRLYLSGKMKCPDIRYVGTHRLITRIDE